MKKLFATSFALLFMGMLFAQTLHNPNITPTITDKEIIEMGQNQPNRAVTVLDFEGLGNNDQILNFYNGGTSSQGYSGTNYGIGFGANSLSIIDADAGGTGNFANEPSPSTVLFFLTGTAVMNVPAGFGTGFSFYYTSSAPGTVYVYDGLDATGNLLATANFPAVPLGTIGGDPNGYFDNWVPFGVSFSGTARSVDFTGVQNQCGFDDITFGSITPGGPSVPLSNWALYLGIFLIFTFIVIRFRRLV